MSGFIRQMVSDRYLLRIAVVAAIGGFLFGYDTGVIGGALLFIKASLHAESNLAQQSIVASLLVGAIVGALAGGWLAGAFGRRRTLIAAGWIYVAGGLASAFSQDLWQLVGRRPAGAGAGGGRSFVHRADVTHTRVSGLSCFRRIANASSAGPAPTTTTSYAIVSRLHGKTVDSA